MALPRQVEEQLKQTEELEKQLYGEQELADPNKPQAFVEQPQVTQEAEPVEAPEEVLAQPEDDADVEEVSQPKAEEAKKTDEIRKWEQKYKTLQGMYDAEVPRLHSQVKELTAKVESLTAATEKAQAAKQEAQEQLRLVTDEDVKEFGEDLIDVQRRVAREVAAEFRAELDALKEENESLRKMASSTDSKVSTASFEQRLHRLVPDFDQVNTSPEWIDWLNEVDPLLRGPRMTVAQQAYESGDAEAVAYYVDLFKQSQAPVEVEAPKKAKAELERQIQPSRSASSNAAPSSKGATYTQADIQNMFTRIAKMGATEEARKLEAEIDAAFMEGRVR